MITCQRGDSTLSVIMDCVKVARRTSRPPP